MGVLFHKEAHDVHAVGIEEQQDQEEHAAHLGVFHEALARGTPEYDLVEQEEHVAAIERNAAMFQNATQSHFSGKMEPMAPKPPMLFIPSFVATCFIDFA